MLPNADPTLYESACAGKERYPSEQAAQAVVILARRGPKHKGGLWDFRIHRDGLQVYRCPFEEVHPDVPWHLGHA